VLFKTIMPPRISAARVYLRKKSDLDFIFVYTCLFQKVSDLQSISISTMCFIISMSNMIILYQYI
jgi:hypothetical protein